MSASPWGWDLGSNGAWGGLYRRVAHRCVHGEADGARRWRSFYVRYGVLVVVNNGEA